MPGIRRSKIVTGGVLAWLAFLACGGTPTAPTEQLEVLLSTSLPLPAGGNCTTSGVSASFTPTTGRTVTINALGSTGVNPAITLYAPDFTTQLGGAQGTSGRAQLTFRINLSGTHHVSVCDLNGVGGTVGVTVTQAR